MDIIRNTRKMNEFDSAVFDMYFGGMSFAAFDIETTGLSPDRCKIILAGFCSCSGGRCETVQFFADDLSEEEELLEAAMAYTGNFDFLITYNGHRFDTPFTLRRAKRHRIDTRAYPYDFDIYPLAKRFSDIGSFVPNLRQKTLENFMGLWSSRTDEIDGGDSVRMYYDYMGCRGTSQGDWLKEKILLHNHDDVVQLYRLLSVTGRSDMHGAMNKLGFPVRTRAGIFRVDSAEVKRDRLLISGKQPGYFYGDPGSSAGRAAGAPIIYEDYGDGNAACSFRPDGTFTIEAALMQQRGMMLADLTVLPAGTEHFEALPTFGSGYLVLDGKMEINLLAQKMVESIIESVIVQVR